MNENSGEGDLVEKFYIEIIDLSNNEKALNDIISEKPAWLLDKGEIDDQRGYLEKNVAVKIHEKFTFDISENTLVYKLVSQKK